MDKKTCIYRKYKFSYYNKICILDFLEGFEWFLIITNNLEKFTRICFRVIIEKKIEQISRYILLLLEFVFIENISSLIIIRFSPKV